MSIFPNEELQIEAAGNISVTTKILPKRWYKKDTISLNKWGYWNNFDKDVVFFTIINIYLLL